MVVSFNSVLRNSKEVNKEQFSPTIQWQLRKSTFLVLIIWNQVRFNLKKDGKQNIYGKS